MENCPCGTNKTYPDCCGVFITGQMLPPTPETLMRSRYTAYTKADINYIQNTMHAPANVGFDPIEARQWATAVEWLGLEVLNASEDGDQGCVEFVAHFSHDNNQQSLHEISEFQRVGLQWFYVNGTGPNKKPLSRASRKPGRNELCACGSQKKYKKCCGCTE